MSAKGEIGRMLEGVYNDPKLKALREQFQRENPELVAYMREESRKFCERMQELNKLNEAAADEFCRLWTQARNSGDEEDYGLAGEAQRDMINLAAKTQRVFIEESPGHEHRR